MTLQLSAMKSWCALVFLVLACLCPDTLSCPALCKCYQRRVEVVCHESSLTEYPTEGLPKNTTMMTIQYTGITSITEQHLNATPLLTGLHLYNNHLQSLPPDFLRGVPYLDTVDLTENKLSDLPADVFSHARLDNLVLKNNQIEKANADWLPDNSSITFLDLSGNRLTKITADFCKKLPRLENLDLSNNRLEKIPSDSLEATTKLRRLNLNDNKLDTLDAPLFESTRNLTYLFLSRNKLNSLPQNLFQGLTQLKAVSLDDNQLSHIPTDLLDPLSSLNEDGLDLSANPWQCDGKVEYLWRWLQKNKKKVFLPETIICAGPEALRERQVMSLTAEELNLQS